ncbi:MAG: CBS domain-containing protein [Infirmifilum sp.]
MAMPESLYELLVTIVQLYESSRRPVTSTQIAEHLGKSDGTVRNTISALKAMGLVEARTGPNGGYIPTVKGLESVKSPQLMERFWEPIPVVINGMLSKIYALELDLVGITDPTGVKAVLRVAGSMHQLRENTNIRLGPTPRTRLVIAGKTTNVDFKRREVLLSVESLVAIPRITAVEVMTPNPLVVSEDEPLSSVAELLIAQGIRALPVVDSQGKLRGLVTASHVAEAYASGDYSARVGKYMDKEFVSIKPETDILDIMRILARKSTGRAIVVDAEDKPLGIVTRTDVLNKLVSFTLA